MREILSNVVDEKWVYSEENVMIVAGVVADRIQELTGDAVKLFLGRIECSKGGHLAHTDELTLRDGCVYKPKNEEENLTAYSCGVLLSKDYVGGNFQFKEPHKPISKKKHYLNGVVFDVEQKHLVTPHKEGDRWVLLMWFTTRSDADLVISCHKDYPHQEISSVLAL